MFALNGLRAAKINLSIYLIGILLFLSPALNSQEAEDTIDPDDQTFVEIILTPEGVIAYDSSESPWVWDFNSESFRPGRLGRRTQGEERFPPVEERASVEKFVNDSERRIIVDFEEYVDGDITTTGTVLIRGWVKGNIRSYSRVLISETGQVDGDVRAPKVTVKNGGVVYGEVDESDLLTDFPDVLADTFSVTGLWVLFGFTIFFSVVGSLIVALMPTKLERLTECATKYAARSFFLGLLFTFLMPMIAGLVAITVIGLVVIWAVPLAYLAAFIIGLVIVGRESGKKLLFRLTGRKGTDIIAYLIGLGALMALWLVVAMLMGSSDDEAFGFGVFFLVIAILISTYPIMTGVGAAFLTRFGFKDYVRIKDDFGPTHREASTPAPPPLPNGDPRFDSPHPKGEPPTPGPRPIPPAPKAPPAIFPPDPKPSDSND